MKALIPSMSGIFCKYCEKYFEVVGGQLVKTIRPPEVAIHERRIAELLKTKEKPKKK